MRTAKRCPSMSAISSLSRMPGSPAQPSAHGSASVSAWKDSLIIRLSPSVVDPHMAVGGDGTGGLMQAEEELRSLKEALTRQQTAIEALTQQLGLLQDQAEIERLQYAYGYFIDNRMFREMADLFADEGAWIEIGGGGRDHGKGRLHPLLPQG